MTAPGSLLAARAGRLGETRPGARHAADVRADPLAAVSVNRRAAGLGWLDLASAAAEKVPGSGRGTAIYVRQPSLKPILLQNQDGYLAAARVPLPGGRSGTALSVHAPTDTKLIGSSLTRYLRPVFDSLASELSHFRGRCFVGGDFNLSRGFDTSYRLSGDRSHEGFFAWLDSEHSLVECCCADGEKRSLYRGGRAHPHYQLDHLFVSRGLADSRGACTVRDWSVGSLSDHAPVVGVFAVASAG